MQSIIEIDWSVIKPLTTDSMASIRLVIMFKLFFAHAPRGFVWLLDLHGKSFGSYHQFTKQIFTNLGRGILKKPQ